MRTASKAVEASTRCNIYDMPPTLRNHHSPGRLAHMERTRQIHIDHPLPVRRWHLQEVQQPHRSCRVHYNVEPPETLNDSRHRAVNVSPRPNISSEPQHLPTASTELALNGW